MTYTVSAIKNQTKQIATLVGVLAIVLVGLVLGSQVNAAEKAAFNLSFTGPATAVPGQLVTYKINITNPSNVAAKNVIGFINFATITPQDTLMYIPDISDKDCTVGSLPGKPSSQGVNCKFRDLNGGGDHVHANVTFKVRPTVACGTAITNVVDVGADNAETIWAAHTFPVECAATPTPTPTPTPAPEPEKEKHKDETRGINISKTDNRDVTRPTHVLTYVITVENTGNQDIDDAKIVDTVPAHLSVGNISNSGTISGRTITWNDLHLSAGEKKQLSFKATVAADTPNAFVLNNKVKVNSEDHGLADEASDTTVVQRLPQVLATATPAPVAVPVTARTGAEGIVGAALSTLLGGAGLALSIRKSLK